MTADAVGALSQGTVAVQSRAGIALQGVMELLDRVAIGYEARPRGAVDAADFVAAAVSLTQHAGPAVVFVPVSTTFITDGSFDAAYRVRALGALPGEVGWLLEHDAGEQLTAAQRQSILDLRAAGFRLAVEATSLASLSSGLVPALLPDFVFLDAKHSTHLDDDVAKAELAATVAFVARLGGRLVARGINTSREALALAALGVQFGIGAHLARPVVLDPAVAGEGDEVVASSWFRSRDVRVIEERGAALDAPFILTSLSVHDGMVVDERTFARLLGESARALQAEHDMERILRMAAELAVQVMPCDRMAIFEADWTRHRLVPRVAAGVGMEGLAHMDSSMNDGITGWAFSNGLPYRCEDTDSHPAAATIPGSVRFEESLLVIPLIAGDHRIGALDLWRDGLNSFSAEELERASLIGYILAAAWRNAQLYAELEQRTFTDALTGLLNIRWWNEIAHREAAQSLRSDSQIGIIVLDLDNFKRINDVAGHAVGDAALRNVSRALRDILREGDAAVRYGGEEFLIMLPDSGADGAMRVAEAVHAGLAALPPPAPELPCVTASIGIALFPQHGRNLDDVARAADMAMYGAKRSGGNAIAMAPQLPAA